MKFDTPMPANKFRTAASYARYLSRCRVSQIGLELAKLKAKAIRAGATKSEWLAALSDILAADLKRATHG